MGTSDTNLSAYERDVKRPNRRTLARAIAAIDAGAGSPIHTRQLVTVPAAAALLRKGLKEQWTTPDLLRVIREMRSNAKFVERPADRLAFFAEPSTTGDARWDAMLAGNVEELALAGHFPAPAWTQGHALAQFWFVGSMPSLVAYSFARSPMSLQIRGVMIDPADLESV